MMIGNPSIFAIESVITTAYSRLSFRALGYFTIFVKGHRYGVHRPDATMLACSFDEVERRLKSRGTHTAPSFRNYSSIEIAEAFRKSCYLDDLKHNGLDSKEADCESVFFSKHLVWAPDGDSAFDDSSYVLQFDIDNNVRLVAFKAQQSDLVDRNTIYEVVLKADEFYIVLEQWHDKFIREWNALPKLLD